MRAGLAAGALLAFSPLFAQTPSMPHLGETIDVSVVNVDVFVTDKKGARVYGLTKNDFQIFENGVAQPITNFSEYRGDQTAIPQPEGETPVASRPQKRTVVIFIDDMHLSKPASDAFFRSIKELLHKAIRPGDSAMIVSWQAGHESTVQPMSGSLPVLDESLDRIAALTTRVVIDEQRQAKIDADAARQFELQIASDNREATASPFTRADAAEASWAAEMEGRSRAKKAQADQNREVDALRTLIRTLAGDEGRKLMILATHRLSSIAGAEFSYAQGTSPLAVGEMRQEMSAAGQLKYLYQAANADGVAIYTLYPEGMRDPIVDASMGSDGRMNSPTAEPTGNAQFSDDQIAFAVSSNETSALRLISDQTGGRSASGRGSANLLMEVQEDLDSYYSLGYRATPGKSDRSRSIQVKTTRPDLVIRSRHEYVAKSETTQMEDRVIAALYRPPPAAPFQIGVMLAPPLAVARGVVIPVTVRIPIAALTTIPESGEYAGAFSVYFASGAKSHLTTKTSHVTKPFRIAARDLAKAKEGYYSYAIKLLGEPATDRIVLGVVDEVSKEYAVSTLTFKLALPGTRR